MKKALLMLLAALLMFAFSCQVAGTGNSGNGGGVAVTVDGDVVEDVLISEGEEFDFSTVKSTPFCVEVKNEQGEVIEKVALTITEPDGKVIKQVLTEADKTKFIVFTNDVSGKLTVKVNHPNYEERVIEIDDFNKIKELVRTLTLKYAENPDYLDSDGDNIPDEVDIFDDQSEGSEYIYTEGFFHIFYEDLYPCRGDMDFNDVVVRLDMTAYDSTKTGKYISKIKLKYQVLASGAGYTDVGFYIAVNSTDPAHPFNYWITPNGLTRSEEALIPNVKRELLGKGANLGQMVNAKNEEGSTYRPGQLHEIVVDFEAIYGEPICDLYFPYLPLDPYIVVRHNIGSGNNVEKEFARYNEKGMDIKVNSADNKQYLLDGKSYRREVHLPFAHTTYKGMLKDYEGFTWAMVTDKGVNWPLLGMDIHKAYPNFKSWYTSNGQTNRDWMYYPKTPLKNYVYTFGQN